MPLLAKYTKASPFQLHDHHIVQKVEGHQGERVKRSGLPRRSKGGQGRELSHRTLCRSCEAGEEGVVWRKELFDVLGRLVVLSRLVVPPSPSLAPADASAQVHTNSTNIGPGPALRHTALVLLLPLSGSYHSNLRASAAHSNTGQCIKR